jgi:HEAT repeat protein
MSLSPCPPRSTPPPATPPTSVSLEAGTNLIVLARMVGGKIERLRAIDDSCPVDANGRTVYWLTGVTPADSIRYLDTLTRQDALNIDTRRRLAESAIEAIALHKDAAADAILDRLAADQDSGLRQRAATSLASLRGAHGFDTLKRLLDAERDRGTRRTLASSLGQTRQPGTADLMLGLARTDPDPDLRATAVNSYASRAGQGGVQNVLAIIDKDTADQVKQRAVSGLARLPVDVSVPPLINLAKTTTSPAVRKQAVSSLGQIRDPRAAAYLAEILAK